MTIETVTIPKSEYDNLIKREVWLQCLEGAGVDNWDGMEYAIESFELEYPDE